MRLGLALAALASTLLLAGCEKPAKATCPVGKLCMHIGNMADPVTVDPNKVTTVQEDFIISDMFIGLLTDDAHSNAVPGMAESWTTSPDGLVWTFKLRDALWSDGVPVTADDFVFSMRRLQDPATASQTAYMAYVVKNAQAVNGKTLPPEALGMKALDAKTLQITLEHPAPYLPTLLRHQSFYPVPAHTIRKWGDDWVRPEHFVANGPFVLKSWKLGDKLRVVKNPRFYDAGNVCLDELYFYPTIDSISAERRVRSGELDANVDIQSNRIARLRQPDQIPAYVRTNTWVGVDYLVFNHNLAKFKDRRVRLALAMAIDREFITNKLMRAGQKPAYGFVPPGVSGYGDGPKPFWASWSLEKRQVEARRLLAEAGYTTRRPLKFSIKQRNTSDPMLIMPAVQADWRSIGVDVALEPNESQIAYQAYRVRDFEVADASWIGDYDDALTFLSLMDSKTGVQNYGDYKNPAYDALIDRSEHEPDPTKREAILKQAEAAMNEDAAVATVYFYVSKNLVNPAVTGWEENVPDHHRRRWVCFKDAAARRAASRE